MLNNQETPLPRTKTEERPLKARRAQSATPSECAAVAAIVRAAVAGDECAWQSLVERFTPALRAAARGFKLSHADVDDVVQTTWLAAVVHIRRLDKPESIGAWLLVTARRESLRTLQQATREVVTDEPPCPAAPDNASPENMVIETERRHGVHGAVRRLPNRQRLLLDTLLSAPSTSYADLSLKLDMPVGSIGPTRDRALGRLRRDHTLTQLLRDDPAA